MNHINESVGEWQITSFPGVTENEVVSTVELWFIFIMNAINNIGV